MHPIHWIYNNRDLLQAISGLAIAFLTLIIIGITAFYATANWRTMRLMDADVRFRLKPIPSIVLTAASKWDLPGGQNWVFIIRSDHAPLTLVAASLRFTLLNGKELEHFHVFKGQVVHTNDPYQCALTVPMPAVPQSWILELYYRDLSRFLHYVTRFDANGFLDEGEPVNPKTLWNRTRIWFGNRSAKKHLGFS